MSPYLSLACELRQSRTEEEWRKDSEEIRQKCLIAVKEVMTAQPEPEEIIYDLICLLLVLPVADRLHIQRAFRPLAQKLDCVAYLSNVSRALQETDAWVDLNILSDKGRRSLPDMGLEINPEFKLP